MSAQAQEAARPLILVVDDEDLVRRIACQGLQRLGYDVIDAHDGDSALKCKAGKPERPITSASARAAVSSSSTTMAMGRVRSAVLGCSISVTRRRRWESYSVAPNLPRDDLQGFSYVHSERSLSCRVYIVGPQMVIRAAEWETRT